mmetsp:Transcript_25885/g.67119  ORF Transcript_25885/g.67119 Transcript_25885/m.67119 type:complete len:280 (+) Transcript_25885:658-1497(+)
MPAPDCWSPRINPIDSGVMISYVCLFLIMPSWWMPLSCWKALAPTMALWGWTAMPVYSLTMFDVGVMWTGSIPVRKSGPSPQGPFAPKCVGPLRARAMTTSSRAALPARSPIPLIVHSIWRAPCAAPAIELAVLSPRSFWQCVENTTRSAFSPNPSRSCWIRGPNSHGTFHPVVSGIFNVVAPASTTADNTLIKNSGSERPASSGENSISSQPRLLANFTASTAICKTSSGVFLSFVSMWMGDVAMKVWTRGLTAGLTASQARSMSLGFALDSPQMTGT